MALDGELDAGGTELPDSVLLTLFLSFSALPAAQARNPEIVRACAAN
jgi:hypothetical protein